MLHMSETQDNLVHDIGAVQNKLASILPPDSHFYVDAKKNDTLSASLGFAVYSYENTEEETQLHHKTSSSDGNCLTYSSTLSNGLQSVGVDCESKLMPLCFREVGASDLSFINEQCGDCNDFSVTPTCNKWEKLEDYYEQGDAFKVTGLDICTDLCGPKVRKRNEYCLVGLTNPN